MLLCMYNRLIGLRGVEVYAINNFFQLLYLSIEIDCIDEDYFSIVFNYSIRHR